MALFGCVVLAGAARAAVVPVVADLGSYPPFKNNDNTSVHYAQTTFPVFLKFTILAISDFQAGLKNQKGLDLSGFDIVNFNTGTTLATGVSCATNDCGTGPFNPNTIDYLVTFAGLSTGAYALKVSGTGTDARNGSDFIARVTGSASVVPLPAALPLLMTAIAGLWGAARLRRPSISSSEASPTIA